MKTEQLISALEKLRITLKIPGMAAALMQGDSVIFIKGFGFADTRNRIPVTEKTTFRIASVTKTFTSTLVMQLVEKGKLDLHTPVSKFSLDFGNPGITVLQLLTHTSEEDPGTHFQYSGFRFGQAGAVVEKITGKPFYQTMLEQILLPARMNSSAPGIPPADYLPFGEHHPEFRHNFKEANANLAKPYALNAKGENEETTYLNEFGAFGGLITNVKDLLSYSRSIDSNKFISAGMQQKVFTPNKTKNGSSTPYGIGWFVMPYRGLTYYWHYGQTQGESALFIKCPQLRLTLAVTANSDMLSAPFPLGDGDLFTSPVAQLLFEYFVSNSDTFSRIDFHAPEAMLKKEMLLSARSGLRDFANHKLLTQSILARIDRDTAASYRLLKIYAELNFTHARDLPKNKLILSIWNVGVNTELVKPFELISRQTIRIYGVGENCSGNGSSWCDFGWIQDEAGKIAWSMQGQHPKPAGGAAKNQLVDTAISLPPGRYFLHYKSDGGHAFNNWDSAPPDHYSWGIRLYGQSKQLRRN